MYMLNYIFSDKTVIESIIYNVPRVCQTLGTFIGHDARPTRLGGVFNVKIERVFLACSAFERFMHPRVRLATRHILGPSNPGGDLRSRSRHAEADALVCQ